MPPWEFPPSLTLQGLKDRLDHKLAGNDELLGEYLEAAFEQAQAPWPDGCGRLLRPDPAIVVGGTPEAPTYADTDDPVERTFPLRGRRKVVLPDLRELTGDVLVDGTVVPADSLEAQGYELTRHQGQVVLIAVPTGSYGEITIMGRWGFGPLLPADLREAIYTLAQRYWHERAAMQSDSVQLEPGAPAQAYYRQLPPRVRLTFSKYKLPGAIGGAA